MAGWISGITLLGVVLGAAAVTNGIVGFVSAGSLPSLLIAVAILIVGPGEDWLVKQAKKRCKTEEEANTWVTLVDRSTSALFLLLLGLLTLWV